MERGSTGGSDREAIEGLEVLAAAWLAAEDDSLSQPGNAGLALEAARLGEAYEAAVGAISREELRIAWEAAQRVQAEKLIGSTEWAAARRVSELLRAEYAAVAR
jgi:hypothetical protein